MAINISMIDKKYYNGTQDLMSSTAMVKSQPLVGDILDQISSTEFLVRTNEGSCVCKLVRRIKSTEQMTITATHYMLGTFNILEITPEWVLHPNGNKYPWVIGAKNAFGDTVGLVSL